MTSVNAKKPNNSFASSFHALKTLTAMQLKEKMDLSFVGNFQKSLFKLLYFIIELVVVTVICSTLLKYAAVLGVFDISPKIIPSSVIGIIFTFMLILSVISATWNLLKSLYLSRDNLVLLTLPASSSTVFLSKIAVYFIYEMRKNFMFLIPLFVAYGINHEYAFYYYIWLVFLFLFISLLPVLIAALLSIPTLFVYQFLKRTKFLQYILTGVLLGGVAFGVFKLINLIPADINFSRDWHAINSAIRGMLAWFETSLRPLYVFTQLIAGKQVGAGLSGISIFHDGTLPTLGILIVVLIVLLVLCFLIAKPLFYTMASTPFEFTKKIIKYKPKNRKTKPFISSLKKEFIISVKSGEFLSIVALLVVVQPIAIELLNRIYAAMDTRYLGDQMKVTFNLFIMLLINLSTNISMASVYSRDGATSYLNKVQPSSFAPILFSKLVINLVVALIGIAVTSVRLSYFYAEILRLTNLVLFVATIYMVFVSHLFLSAEMDIMNPQTSQYATFSEQANNPNENMSAIYCFLLSFLVFGVALLLALESSYKVWIKMTIVVAVFMIYRIASYILKIRAFYGEK